MTAPRKTRPTRRGAAKRAKPARATPKRVTPKRSAKKRPGARPSRGARGARAAIKPAARSGAVATPGEILRPYPPSVRKLSHELRKLIRRTLPGVTERTYTGWHGIGYHDRQSGYLCGIFPQPDCVKLYFEHGSMLPDPHHVLTGTAAQVRHVSCWPDVPVPERAIRELLATAVRFGAVR